MSPSEEPFANALQACEEGRAADLARLLRDSPELVKHADEDGWTLLLAACDAFTGERALPPVEASAQQHAVLELLLSAGADPSASDAEGWAPLHTAAMTGNEDLANTLLKAGAARAGNLLGTEGGSALALALFYAKPALGELLAQPSVSDNLRTAAALGRDLDRFFEGQTPSAAAKIGLDFYRPTAQWPDWERTFERQELLDEALAWAARNGQVGSLQALVARGANVNSNSYRGTPLLWAIYSDREDVATWLLDHGADPDLKHDFGGTGHGVGAVAMHLAAQYSGLKCLRLLLERGADMEIQDDGFSATPMEWAMHSDAEAAVRMLTDF